MKDLECFETAIIIATLTNQISRWEEARDISAIMREIADNNIRDLSVIIEKLRL